MKSIVLSDDNFKLVSDCLEELIIRRREAGIGIYHVQEVLKKFHSNIDDLNNYHCPYCNRYIIKPNRGSHIMMHQLKNHKMLDSKRTRI